MPAPTNLCACCGEWKPRLDFGGNLWCAACQSAAESERKANLIREANRRRYARRKRIGQWQRCDQPARPGGLFCAECARKKSERAKATRREARAGAKG
jgi:hypothetical protein